MQIPGDDEEVGTPPGVVAVVVTRAPDTFGGVAHHFRVLPPGLKQRRFHEYSTEILHKATETLVWLDQGESLEVRLSGGFWAKRYRVTNDAGRARIERAGLARWILGRAVA